MEEEKGNGDGHKELDFVEMEDFDTHGFTTTQLIFDGMCVYNNIHPHRVNSFFKIRINGVRKYLHRQTTCWMFSEQKQTLSSD